MNKILGKLLLLACSILVFGYYNCAYAKPILLKAKQYLDVSSGVLVKPANIVIDQGYIKAINPSTLPKDIKTIQLSGLTLLPGFIDSHVHLPIAINKGYQLRFLQTDTPTATLNAVNNAHKLLMAGFTTVRNLGQIHPSKEFIDVALAKASEAGQIAAPHIIPAGHALSITGGHMDVSGMLPPGEMKLGPEQGIVDGVDEAVKATRYQIKYGAKAIKIAATAGVLSNEASVGAQQFSAQEMNAIVNEAKRHGVFVAAHAHGTAGINAAIRAGVRSIEHGSLLNDESIRLMKEHGTYLVPTAYVLHGLDLSTLSPAMRKKAEIVLPLARKSLVKAIKAGVNIAFGTDSAVIPHGENAKEFAEYVQAGMSPLAAIQTATVNASKMLGLNDRGQLKTNELADIIAVNGNPLTDIKILQHIVFVMKQGEIYKNKLYS